MKKMSYIKNFYKYSVISLLAGFLFLSCGGDSGLGPEVDLSAPVVKLTSHEDNDTVPSCFTLIGTAYDNEGVSNLTIDFDDADIHFKIVPGGKWKKKAASTSGSWTEMEAGEGSCILSADKKTWNWSVYVNTEDASPSWTDSTYELKIISEDAIGNSGKNSNLSCALTVDTANPDVSVYKPELFNGAYSAVAAETENYRSDDGNVIAKLKNGDITFQGRQENSISFKELRIEFDNGGLASGTSKVTGSEPVSGTSADTVADSVSLGEGEENRTVYYSKTLKSGQEGISDLRNWTFTLKADDWVNDSKNPELKSGKHLIRMVTTSVSDSQAWQKKVIGYFIWWPEADTPWITTYTGDDEDKGDSTFGVFPSANFSGTAQDDDGIASLSYVINKKSGSSWEKQSEGELPLSEKGTTYTPWTVTAPNQNGIYKISINILDLYGTSSSITKYFRILDVKPPKIEVKSPVNGSSLLADSNGKINFDVEVTDDGSLQSFEIVYLNPEKSRDADNKIKYLSGTDDDFKNASESGYTDTNGNVVYKISLPSPSFDTEKNLNVYRLSKIFDIFADLKIDGKTRFLNAQDFVLRALDDGGSNSVLSFSLAGDSDAPVITIDSIESADGSDIAGNQKYNFIEGQSPSIDSGKKVVLKGTWKDNSTTAWNNPEKISEFKINWLEMPYELTKNSDGTWQAVMQVPNSSSAIVLTMKDFAGNESTVSRSVQISGAAAEIDSVGAENDDGSYKAGTTIKITLNFNKNVNLASENHPVLTLSNDKEAQWVSSSNGSSIHVFNYTISQNDTNGLLGVKSLSETEWKDVETGNPFNPVLPTASSKTLDGTRKIYVDTKSPKIDSVKVISSPGNYGKDSAITFRMDFTENVKFPDNTSSLKLKFNNDKETSEAVTTSSSVIFTYTVSSDDDVEKLELKGFTGSGITDEAGNPLDTASITGKELDKTIRIDTTSPNPPMFRLGVASWNPPAVVFDSNGTSFLLATNGATDVDESTGMEYCLDYDEEDPDKAIWIPYKKQVDIKNNGNYRVTARQTDKAGNTSNPAPVKKFTVDIGGLLTRITASTVNGTYSTQSATKIIEGKIEFRKAVTIESGATVTLNVKNENDASTEKTVDIKECMSSAATSSVFTFDYPITDGDSINAEDKLLDVTKWSFTSVTFNGADVDMAVPEAGDGKRFNENRQIKIVTGKPKVESVELTGENENAKLTITFDREITKVGGNIVIEQDTSTYRVPAVLSVSKYMEILDQWNELKNYYKAGTNGATKAETGNTLSNDTETKYILDYDYDIDNNTLTSKFTELEEHKVSIPIVASAVTASGNNLSINLGSTYKLPTKGVSYNIAIPAGAVVDSCQNKNEESPTNTATSSGVEAPVIRIQKSSYKINNMGNTKNASVTLPETAKMRIDCRTPDAKIKFSKNESPSTKKSITNVTYNDTKTEDVAVSENYELYTTEVTLGDGNNTTNSLSYNNLTGLKIAIAAYAYSGAYDIQDKRSSISYEYATRTVLKFIINADGKNAYDNGQGNANVTVSDGAMNMHDLQIWVQGGDAASGTNSIETFPLSWGKELNPDETTYKFNYKIMKSFTNSKANPWTGTWAWVTWDLSAPAYHGFVAGDVPSDADVNGPKVTFAGECGWNAYKDNYVLYPGETLEMCLTNNTNLSDKSGYFFRLKNKATR